jgi:MazG family protein
MKTAFEQLEATMAALRDKDSGCPWDLQQDHLSLIPYLLEETYEVIDALESGDDEHLCEELGDLLMQIIFHAQIAREEGRFSANDVAKGINEKLIRRHPHVFGDSNYKTDAELEQAWEQSKSEEKPKAGNQSLLAGVIAALPSLMRAQKLQRRAARVGFDWPDHRGPLDKVSEETEEIREALAQDQSKKAISEEIGDLLFSVVNLARHLDIDAEEALRQSNQKFTHRFQYIEQQLEARNKSIEDCSTETLEGLWIEAKNRE